MDAQQELFMAIRAGLINAGLTVYDGALPPEGAEYPYVYLADSTSTDEYLKNALFGMVDQTVHIWHDDSMQRGTFSAICKTVKDTMRKLESTDNYGWMINGIDQTVLADDSTTQPLIHATIQATYRFSS